MARRGQGEGTIVIRKTCPECKKVNSASSSAAVVECKHCKAELPKTGTWMGAATLGFDVEKNKPQRKYFYGKTRKEVQEKISDAAQRMKNGQAEPSKMLLAEWMDTWLHEYMKPSVRATTWESYETQIRKHIKPALGHIRLSQLQTSSLQKLYNEKTDGGRADGKDGGLSPRSVKYIHTVLHSALEQAKKERMIMINPADSVKLPKQQKKEIQYMESADLTKFFQAAKGTKYFPAYYLELATGLRRGELLAIRWQDVDFKNHTVTVNQNLVRVKGKGLIFQPPKTKLANRTISIPADVTEVLKFHKRKQDSQREAAGVAWLNNDLVFCNEIGQPLDPRSFTHYFERLLKNADIPPVTFHGLRHTYATMALQEGVDIRTTQENLGHHAAAFTLDVYSSVTDKMKKEATDKIGNLLTSYMG